MGQFFLKVEFQLVNTACVVVIIVGSNHWWVLKRVSESIGKVYSHCLKVSPPKMLIITKEKTVTVQWRKSGHCLGHGIKVDIKPMSHSDVCPLVTMHWEGCGITSGSSYRKAATSVEVMAEVFTLKVKKNKDRNCPRLEEAKETGSPNAMWHPDQKRDKYQNLNQVCGLKHVINTNLLFLIPLWQSSCWHLGKLVEWYAETIFF